MVVTGATPQTFLPTKRYFLARRPRYHYRFHRTPSILIFKRRALRWRFNDWGHGGAVVAAEGKWRNWCVFEYFGSLHKSVCPKQFRLQVQSIY